MNCRSLRLSVGSCVFALVCAANTCFAANAYYRVAEVDGVWWFLDPQGKPFYSLGVSDIGPGPGREAYDAERPAYAAFQNYDSTDEWAEHSLQRLRDWKFNTVGSWADASLTRGPMPYAVVLHLGSQVGFPWNDAFGDDFAVAIDKLTRDRVRPQRDDKNLLGWFTDNEQSWYPNTLFSFHLKQPRTSVTRSKLIEFLMDQYGGDFQSLLQDFEVTGATTFDELGQAGGLKLRPDGDGRRVILRFTAALADRYYQVVHDAIRRYDPNHLILGDRYAWHCPGVVAKAAAPYVDVISTNFDWPEAADGFLPSGYLRSLHRVTKKPVLVTEYYVAARENRSGNKNSGGIFLTVGTQQERTAAFKNRLRGLAEQPYVVGAHWFRFADEPTHGRPKDGEDYNFGLVDIRNRPYDGLTTAMTRLHSEVPQLHRESRIADQRRSGPIPVPLLGTETNELHKQLDNARSLEPADQSLQLYELLAAWNPKTLHIVALICHVPERKTDLAMVRPEGHELELTIESAALRVPVRVRFGGLQEATTDSADVKCWLAAKGLRQSLVIALPAALFKSARLEAGRQLAIKITLDDFLDKQKFEWESEMVLSGQNAENSQSPESIGTPDRASGLQEAAGE